jgi:hypothetical protein
MPVERQQVIRERAYAIWEQEGREDGEDVAHWLRAENEIDSTEALLKAIRDAMFISNRAFVFLKKLEWQFIGQKSTHTIVRWMFIPQWENGGNTPTKYMTHRINYAAFERTINSTFECPDVGDLEVSHTMIGPKAIMHGAQIDIPVDVLDKIKNGELHAYLWGWADYNDVFPGTPRHRSEFCFEIIVHGDVRTENCQFFFHQQGRHNGFDDECLHEPRPYVPQGEEQSYKFLDTTDIDKVLIDGTIKVSSFEYFRQLEAARWGDIADPLEGASELTAKGEFVLRENSPELEMANKANIGLGMFQKFAEVESGGLVDISNARFVHAIPNLFILCEYGKNCRTYNRDVRKRGEALYRVPKNFQFGSVAAENIRIRTGAGLELQGERCFSAGLYTGSKIRNPVTRYTGRRGN